MAIPSIRWLRRRMVRERTMEAIAEWQGFCPICQAETTFRAYDVWLREHLTCTSCVGGSVPRERAIMLLLNRLHPHWPKLQIHESSPAPRGMSIVLARDCSRYVPTQFFPSVPLGSMYRGVRCENLDAQSFPDDCFDIVITQDVMEHVFHPDQVYREVFRTLRPGGLYLHTTPIDANAAASIQRAELMADGTIRHLCPPEYHGNPIDDAGSLVTFQFGRDLPDLIASWTQFSVEIVHFNDRWHGLVAEFLDVLVCVKPPAS